MKKLGVLLSVIILTLICQNCNYHVAGFKEVGVDYAGVLGYGVNPFDATDSCLYFYSDPADEYGQGRTYVLIQTNNALISIMDSSGNIVDSVFINRYKCSYEPSIEFPDVIVSDTTMFSPWPIANIHIKNCPETLYWDPHYEYQSYCIGDNVGIHTGCSGCYCNHREVPFQMRIEEKAYDFMMIKNIYHIEK